MKYEYKFIEHIPQGENWKTEHREIINEHGQLGWRLVSIHPTAHMPGQGPITFDLIFERPAEQQKSSYEWTTTKRFTQ